MNRAFFALSLVLITACGAKKPPLPVEPAVTEVVTEAGAATETEDAAPPQTLYDRLGGKDGLAAVVDSFSKNLVADPRVNKLFKKNKDHLERFKAQLSDQLCQAAGGPCQYGGKSMKDAHKGMGITDAQFDAVVEDLKLALDEKGVAENDKSELFAALAPMREEIVEKKGKKK